MGILAMVSVLRHVGNEREKLTALMVAVIGAAMLPRVVCDTGRERLGLTTTGSSDG